MKGGKTQKQRRAVIATAVVSLLLVVGGLAAFGTSFSLHTRDRKARHHDRVNRRLQEGAPGELNSTIQVAQPLVRCDSSQPAQVKFEEVTILPARNGKPSLVLRNVGSDSVNLDGWTVQVKDQGFFVFGGSECESTLNSTLEPSESVTLHPLNESTSCGLSFTLPPSGMATLMNENFEEVANVSWINPGEGTTVHAFNDGFLEINQSADILNALKSSGQFKIFIEALQTAGLGNAILAAQGPLEASNSGLTDDFAPSPESGGMVFPWWFGYKDNQSRQGQIQTPNPLLDGALYTVFAPTDEAFQKLLFNLSNDMTELPLTDLLRLPELQEILSYHIVPGILTTEDLKNGSVLASSLGPPITVFRDGCMTGGKLMLHDACIDKPTPDPYTCYDQSVWGKCLSPLLTSPLAAQWQGGFCEKTCKRCSCSKESGFPCSEVVLPDVLASNGIIHGIGRVLFPPAIFEENKPNVSIAPAAEG